jgi:hypothetical protein
MGKNLDLGSRSGIKISGHISERLVTTFWVKNTLILCQFIDSVPGPESGVEKSRSGFGTENPDPGSTSRIPVRKTGTRYSHLVHDSVVFCLFRS